MAGAVARLLVAGRWWVIAFWAAACVLAVVALPSLSSSHSSGGLKGLLPEDTPAIATELRSVDLFGFPLAGRTVVVQRDPAGLTPFDQARTAVNAAAVTAGHYQHPGALRGALPVSNALGVFPASRERDTTALTYLLFDPTVSLGTQTRAAERYIRRGFGPRDSVVGITGSVPARAEQGDLIRESLPLVESLTLAAIVGIVGIAFRSVVAPLVTVVTTGVAYVLILRLSGAVAALFGVSSPSELEPVVVALLLGVVTDYAVFYLAAMRRQLGTGTGRLESARTATRAYAPIVAVAGLAVAAGTAALMVANSPFFKALGPALVFTVVMGLLVAATLVPALLAVLGGWAFWPTPPQVVVRRERENGLLRRGLVRLANRRRFAAYVLAGCVVGLLLAAAPLTGLGLGVSFVGSLPADSGVRQAASAARAGFADGILSPTTVLVEGRHLGRDPAALDVLGALLEEQPGVAGVLGPGDLPRPAERRVLLTEDGSAARYLVILDQPALGASAISAVDGLQDRLPRLLASSGLAHTRAGVSGDTAAAAFVVEQTRRDLMRIALAALGANLLMLVMFLRAPVTAVAVLCGSMLSLGATLGLTMALFGALEPGAGLTFYVPFAVAVLLLAFGSDYNIFAVGNIWEQARDHRLPDAVVRAMPGSVSALLVAGLALAASFGLLAVVPLVPFRQLAFAMGVGIALDVLVVRSMLVPSIITLLGPLSTWPRRRMGAVTDVDEHGEPEARPGDPAPSGSTN